jgi:uncharacterized Tic20 family protein
MTNGSGLESSSQEARNIVLLVWVGTIFFSFVPALIVYLIKKDDAYVADQSKEALNWSVTMVIGYCVAFVLSFLLIGFLVFPILWVCNLIFCILGAVAGSGGKPYRTPFAIRLVQ